MVYHIHGGRCVQDIAYAASYTNKLSNPCIWELPLLNHILYSEPLFEHKIKLHNNNDAVKYYSIVCHMFILRDVAGKGTCITMLTSNDN